MIEVGGNASANSIYEAFIPEGTAKPGPGATHEQKKTFIRSKYELQDFMNPNLKSLPSKAVAIGDERTSTVVQAALLNQEGMEDSIGMLKIKVVKGTNLAVRDMLSSDPYVVLNMGTQGYWMVKRAVGTKACLLGKAVNCRYIRQDNFQEGAELNKQLSTRLKTRLADLNKRPN